MERGGLSQHLHQDAMKGREPWEAQEEQTNRNGRLQRLLETGSQDPRKRGSDRAWAWQGHRPSEQEALLWARM